MVQNPNNDLLKCSLIQLLSLRASLSDTFFLHLHTEDFSSEKKLKKVSRVYVFCETNKSIKKY